MAKIKELESEEEAIEFLTERNPGSYFVWVIDPLTGRVASIILGSNLVDTTVHYDPEEVLD